RCSRACRRRRSTALPPLVLGLLQLLPAPAIGVRRVDGRPQERTSPELVALRPDGVAWGGARRVLIAEEPGRLGVGAGGVDRRRLQSLPKPVRASAVSIELRDQRREEPRA